MLETSDRVHLEEQVENLIEDKLQEKFEVQDSLLQTYIQFLTFNQNSDQQSLEVLYQLFQKNFRQSLSAESRFFDLFEHVNIKSYTEVYCESVGSLMKILVNKGRNLTSSFFSRELIIAFNAPPLHILKKKIIPQIRDEFMKEMTFVRKMDNARLSRQYSKLKFADLSATLGQLRKNQENQSHVPVDFFTV